MLLYGGTGLAEELLEDTWISTNGLQWDQVPSTTRFAGSAWSGHIVDSKSQVYKIGGERWNPAGVNSDVWMSSTGGMTWTRQVNTSRTSGLPKRAFPDVYVGSDDTLYTIGGLDGPGLADLWSSKDSGRNWAYVANLPFGSPPGRSSASLLIHKPPALGKEILTYFGGFSRGGEYPTTYHNDIWVSSTGGKTWTRLTDKAPWAERDNFNSEVTKDGLIVLAAGYNSREALNDGQSTAAARSSTPIAHATTPNHRVHVLSSLLFMLIECHSPCCCAQCG